MLLRFCLLNILLVIITASNGQSYIADVEFDKIQQNSVGKYLQDQIKNEITTFDEVKPSLETTSSTDGFCFHERQYVVKDSIAKVWEHYVFTNPVEAWNAKKMNLGLLYSRNKNALIYQDEVAECIETGQLVYLNLSLLRLKNIATAFEIIKVDSEEKVIEFSYIEDNLTQGKQQLHFVETTRGFTKIVHCSYFKSESVLRDHFLYPYFHTRLTNNYHRNMKRLYKNKGFN